MKAPALLIPLLLGYCADETISGYAEPTVTYRLVEIDGAAFAASATISFPDEGKIAGSGPCNTYSATQSAPYPWFAVGPIAATKRVCPELEAEAAFFTALSEMSLSEVAGPVLILSNDAGREMVFQADP
ncbi:MAG: META domain-containing protein [Pseudomonadota bacterium]